MAPCSPFQDVFQRSTSPNQERQAGRTVCAPHAAPAGLGISVRHCSSHERMVRVRSGNPARTNGPTRIGSQQLQTCHIKTIRASESACCFPKGSLQSPSFSKRSVHRRCTTRGIQTKTGKQTHTCNWHCHPLRGLVCALSTSRQWEFSHCGSHAGMVSTELSQQMRQNGSARNSSKVVTSSQST